MRRLLLLVAAALLGATGCGENPLDIDTDPAIFVEATVASPHLEVHFGALGVDLTGGFTLTLHLGARAADSSDVDLQGFEIVSQDQNTLILEALPLRAANTELPVTVDPGDDVNVPIVIDYGEKQAETSEGQQLCTFGVARFRGSISDSLRGTSQPVLTDALTVDCP